jgi:acyl-coenzyme A thioesterase PaaI-like protein
LPDTTITTTGTSESTATTESNCFGCAPKNPIGLRLEFEPMGAGYTTRMKIGANYESFPGVVHGGIVASVLDEVLAQAVYRSGRISAFTSGLRIRYGRPMEIDTEHVAYAEVTRSDDTSVRAAGRIELPGGDLVAAADGTFFLLTDELLKQSEGKLRPELARVLMAANGASPKGADK